MISRQALLCPERLTPAFYRERVWLSQPPPTKIPRQIRWWPWCAQKVQKWWHLLGSATGTSFLECIRLGFRCIVVGHVAIVVFVHSGHSSGCIARATQSPSRFPDWFILRGILKIALIFWVQKITIATLKNRLSLNFTLWNIESATIPTNKTIAVHAWVHLPFWKVLILLRLP